MFVNNMSQLVIMLIRYLIFVPRQLNKYEMSKDSRTWSSLMWAPEAVQGDVFSGRIYY